MNACECGGFFCRRMFQLTKYELLVTLNLNSAFIIVILSFIRFFFQNQLRIRIICKRKVFKKQNRLTRKGNDIGVKWLFLEVLCCENKFPFRIYHWLGQEFEKADIYEEFSPSFKTAPMYS